MKKSLSLLLIFSLSFTLLKSQQQVVFDLDTRIRGNTPRLELFDSAPAENRLEGFLDEINHDIRLVSLIEDIKIIAEDDAEFIADSMTFGRNTIQRSDFTFHHQFIDTDTERGFTIENDGNPSGTNNNNRWGLYANNNVIQLDVLANGNFVGSFASDGTYSASDRKLKKNIQPLNSVMSSIMALHPSSYELINFPGDKKSIGFVAQEVNKYFPELVLNRSGDRKEATMMINYPGFGVLAVKAIQEQQEMIEELKSQVDLLIKRLSALENKT